MEELRIVLSIFATVAAGAVLGFWGWIAVRTIDQGRKIADLEARMNSNERMHEELTIWLRSMDSKLSLVCENVAGLISAFKHYGIERRDAHKQEREMKDASKS